MKFNEEIQSILKMEEEIKFDKLYVMIKRFATGNIRRRYPIFSDADVDTMAHDVSKGVVMQYKQGKEILNWQAYTYGVIKNVVNPQLSDLYNKMKFEVSLDNIGEHVPSHIALYDVYHSESSKNYGDVFLSKINETSKRAFTHLLKNELDEGIKRNLFNVVVLKGLVDDNTFMKMLPDYYECLARLRVTLIQKTVNTDIDNVQLENKIDYR